MREKPSEELEKYRVTNDPLSYSDESFGNNGFFLLPKSGGFLKVQISDGLGWDHVSVSAWDTKFAKNGIPRIPTWSEMCRVKKLFFEPEETVVQFHPPESQYVNHCENCLHLWRPQETAIPLPPSHLVGLKGRKA